MILPKPRSGRHVFWYTLIMRPTIDYHIEQGVGVLRVNRPASRNALNWDAQERLLHIVRAAADTPALRVLIVTGAGERAFVSGGDLKELAHHPEEEAGIRLSRTMSEALERLTALPVPVIAAVNGDAFGGGCEIVTACDLRVAAAHARLCFAHIHNGLTTGWGGAGRLVRLIGQSRATELLLTGRVISADEAAGMGLLHRVLAPGEAVLPAARSWAEELVALPQDALAALKELIMHAGGNGAESTNTLEADLFRRLWTSPNHLEALQAFSDRRQPRFNAGP